MRKPLAAALLAVFLICCVHMTDGHAGALPEPRAEDGCAGPACLVCYISGEGGRSLVVAQSGPESRREAALLFAGLTCTRRPLLVVVIADDNRAECLRLDGPGWLVGGWRMLENLGSLVGLIKAPSSDCGR